MSSLGFSFQGNFYAKGMLKVWQTAWCHPMSFHVIPVQYQSKIEGLAA
jgi:hypothetical protein